jgi:hypothetical protein
MIKARIEQPKSICVVTVVIKLVSVPRQVLEGCSNQVMRFKKTHTISYKRVREVHRKYGARTNQSRNEHLARGRTHEP